MYAQLGNIIFKGLNGFSDLRFEGEEVNYAQFDLINNKPILQNTGTSLIEISGTIVMNVTFCPLEAQLNQLTKYKNDGEVLPLLMGNGKYAGDFVIVSMPYSVDDAYADGTLREISIDISLKEYKSINKLEQKRLAARRTAFAVGDKKPIVIRSPQPPSAEVEIAREITESKTRSRQVSELVPDMQVNPSQLTADKILNEAQKGRVSITTMIDKLGNNAEIFASNPSLKTAGELLLGSFNTIITAYPFSDIVKTVTGDTELQANTRTFGRASTALLQKIIIRK